MLKINFDQFKYGLITKEPINTLPDGAASDSLNWLTKKGADGRGRIELARGYRVMGTQITGTGRITGLKVGKKVNGTEVAFMTYGRKIKYFDEVSNDWIEIGTDTLPVGADGEDITFANFEPRAGNQLWLNSPNSGPYKIMTANPESITSMYDSTKNYKANMAIFDNRAYNWNVDGKDKNAIRMSFIEVKGLADYTQVVSEAVTNGTALATKASKPKASFLDISGIGGAETFTDDLNGNLIGSAGGTGTINYTTGVIQFDPIAGPTASLTVTYRWIDETDSASNTGGIANFVVPSTRISGEPNIFQQLTGGETRAIFSLKDHKFCAHAESIWDILPSLDDTDTTNTIFRDTIGIPYLRAGYSAPEGIYTIDLRDPAEPKFVLIQYSSQTPDIKPKEISQRLDLTGYLFDKAVVFPFGEYIIFACRQINSPVNNRVFVYNRLYNFFDLLDYNISVADLYNGTLIAGDSMTNNVQVLFSGLTSNDANIRNHWKGGISKLGIRRLKKSKKFFLEGEIGPNQKIHVYASLDRKPFVEILDSNGGCFIDGQGDYVDRSQRVEVGSLTLGAGKIGGGSDGIEAYHYARELPMRFGKFSEIELMFYASEIGFASVLSGQFSDVRVSQDKPARRYRSS